MSACLDNTQDPDIEKLSNASCVADVLEMTMEVRDRHNSFCKVSGRILLDRTKIFPAS